MVAVQRCCQVVGLLDVVTWRWWTLEVALPCRMASWEVVVAWAGAGICACGCARPGWQCACCA